MPKTQKKGCLETTAALIGGTLSLAYLANLGGGVVEIIPDNIPVAGNLDEFLASVVLVYCAGALGLPLPNTLKVRK